MEAEAAGVQAQLTAKADGFRNIIGATDSNPDLASLMLMIEQLPELVREQVKAISNLKIDKVTVWDSGSGGRGGEGGNSTSDFLSGLVKSLPPLHELTENVGVKLPEFLGSLDHSSKESEGKSKSSDGGSGSQPTTPAKQAAKPQKQSKVIRLENGEVTPTPPDLPPSK